MTAVTVTANNISANEERGAVIVPGLVTATGVTVSIGQAVYLDSNNQVHLAIADSSAHAQAIGLVVVVPGIFYGETSAPAGSQVSVCVGGPVQGFTGLVNGQPLWIDKTAAGSLNTAAPATAYDWIIGQAVGADTIFVRPGMTTPASA